MLSSLRSSTLQAVRALGRARPYSTALETVPAAPATSAAPGALRPHLNVPAKPDHGLYAFFRKREVDGKVIYDTVEDGAGMQDVFGRAWTAAELRRKSFKDLHTLWYVLLRERNLLATQVENYRRASIAPGMVARTIGTREHQCRKSMARIKYVINERRLAYEGALKILADKKAEAEKEAEPSQIAEGDASEPKAEKAASPVSEAAQLAVDSLLQTKV